MRKEIVGVRFRYSLGTSIAAALAIPVFVLAMGVAIGVVRGVWNASHVIAEDVARMVEHDAAPAVAKFTGTNIIGDGTSYSPLRSRSAGSHVLTTLQLDGCPIGSRILTPSTDRSGAIRLGGVGAVPEVVNCRLRFSDEFTEQPQCYMMSADANGLVAYKVEPLGIRIDTARLGSTVLYACNTHQTFESR